MWRYFGSTLLLHLLYATSDTRTSSAELSLLLLTPPGMIDDDGQGFRSPYARGQYCLPFARQEEQEEAEAAAQAIHSGTQPPRRRARDDDALCPSGMLDCFHGVGRRSD